MGKAMRWKRFKSARERFALAFNVGFHLYLPFVPGGHTPRVLVLTLHRL